MTTPEAPKSNTRIRDYRTCEGDLAPITGYDGAFRKQGKTQNIAIMLPKDLHRQLFQAAALIDRPQGWVVRAGILRLDHLLEEESARGIDQTIMRWTLTPRQNFHNLGVLTSEDFRVTLMRVCLQFGSAPRNAIMLAAVEHYLRALRAKAEHWGLKLAM